MSEIQPIEDLNRLLSEHLDTYQKPDWSFIPTGYRDDVYVPRLVDLLNGVPQNFYVIFDIGFPDRRTFLSGELYDRLLRAQAIIEGQKEATLVYRASRFGETTPEERRLGSTSASRAAMLSGEVRKVFSAEKTPDGFKETLQTTGAQYYVEVNPTGLFMARVRLEPHGIAPYLIRKIRVTAEQISLTPIYDKIDKIPVRIEDFWTA